MTSVTDNRTIELREKLTERGIEWISVSDTCTDISDNAQIVEYKPGVFGVQMRNLTSEQAIAATLGSEINGDTSDGYHTFNELYHHRAVLFSVIVRDHQDIAWKARKHHDGTMYDGMFIVGIETPKGQATYHYDLDPYWEMFDCEEREFAPEWDGHTPDEAIARIAELGSGTLTAEQVRKAIRKYAEDDSCYIFEVYGEMCGLIADELNAMLSDGSTSL